MKFAVCCLLALICGASCGRGFLDFNWERSAELGLFFGSLVALLGLGILGLWGATQPEQNDDESENREEGGS